MMLDDASTGPLSPIYPDPAVHILDQKFTKCRLFNASVEKLASGTRWGEGPVSFGDARALDGASVRPGCRSNAPARTAGQADLSAS